MNYRHINLRQHIIAIFLLSLFSLSISFPLKSQELKNVKKVEEAAIWLAGIKEEFFSLEIETIKLIEKGEWPIIITQNLDASTEIIYGIKPGESPKILFNIISPDEGLRMLYDPRWRLFFTPFTGRLRDLYTLPFYFARCINMKLLDPNLGPLVFTHTAAINKEIETQLSPWLKTDIILMPPDFTSVFIGFDNLASINRCITSSSEKKIVHIDLYDANYNVSELKNLNKGEHIRLLYNNHWPEISVIQKADSTGLMNIEGYVELLDTNNIVIGREQLNEIRILDPTKEYSAISWQSSKTMIDINEIISIRIIDKNEVMLVPLDPGAAKELGQTASDLGYKKKDIVYMEVSQYWSALLPATWQSRQKQNLTEPQIKKKIYSILSGQVLENLFGPYTAIADPLVEGYYIITLDPSFVKPGIIREVYPDYITNGIYKNKDKDFSIIIIIDIYDDSYQLSKSMK